MKIWSVMIVVSLFVLSFASAVVGNTHSASEFWIGVDGSELNLQDAFDSGLLKGNHAYAAPSSVINFGHSVGDVWISTGSGEMTFLNALTSGVKLYVGSLPYSGVTPIGGHMATDVIFNSGDSLQEIINSGSICNADTCVSLGNPVGTSPDGCGGSLDCAAPSAYSWYIGGWVGNRACPTTTYTRSVYCQRDDGISMGSTCGIYTGCDCPKPITSKTTTCTWHAYENYGCSYCTRLPGVCGSYKVCRRVSSVGDTCSSFNAILKCNMESTCSCGLSCTAWSNIRVTKCY